MTTLAIDTHAFVKRLVTAGMPEGQAEIIAEEQARLVEAYNRLIEERLATKHDLEVLKRDLGAEIDRKLAEVKVEMLKWVVGLLLAQTGIIAALVKLL
jgi:hypothetical protein